MNEFDTLVAKTLDEFLTEHQRQFFHWSRVLADLPQRFLVWSARSYNTSVFSEIVDLRGLRPEDIGPKTVGAIRVAIEKCFLRLQLSLLENP